MSRFDATSTLEGLVKRRGNRLRDAVAGVKRLVIMYKLVRRL
jgi:hypothetical protein